ncbi:helix-turn-helix transcriptional regulator [Mucilaginibacter flavus]|uniref:helix-turn-helix transcriptional regulator n=1 Tax=Mucilaginibacter flavus TaxID=931504 RepID=UPI0025B377D8|nr:helix-turn-helix transcriptional regulator [Mucilaginibacter flavus]MDN3584678.1 helix-turn-helix transcriptional regulator [Mucilaginibacter flavus]
MPKKTKSIPVNPMANEFGAGIAIERVSFTNPLFIEGGERAHRHDGHGFFLLESGSIAIEIDFQKYTIKAPSIIYVHPDQVHRTTAFENVTVCSLAITDENLNLEYLKLLEGIAPAKPLLLQPETFTIIGEAVSLCLKLADRKNDKLYHSLLKDSCNAVVALVISQYLALAKPTDKFSRFEIVTKAFRETLNKNFTMLKRPTDYAEKLNISTPYLNECVKNTTGYSVSYHIQQRVILEAKRLLSHSDKTVKEIAADLGFDDYPYFSRLFTKVTGIAALAFRNKNLD